MSILSIQSQVICGHVGHNAATPAWHRLGFEVWAVPSVLYSNHPGHGPHSGFVLEAEQLSDLLAGLGQRGALDSLQAVHTGYLGNVAQGAAVRDLLDTIAERHPSAHYCCDPVIGDSDSGLYVADDLAAFIAEHLVPRCHLATPNQFEMEYLCGHKLTDSGAFLAAADGLIKKGPATVIITSAHCRDRFDSGICTLAVRADEAWLCAQPELAGVPKGTGDLFAALIHARLLQQHSLGHALSLATTSVQRILELGQKAGSDELLVIEGASEIDTPRNPMPPMRLR